MNLLLDTHTFMWFVNGDTHLGENARQRIEHPDNTNYMSIDLPLHHRDPFDRLIIAQAMVEDMTVLTKDENFKHYPIEIIW